MQSHPFQLFRQFKDLLDLQLLTKADNTSSDADIARVIGNPRIASLKQMHGTIAVLARSPSSRVHEGDAIATDAPGVALTIRFADCQNAIIFDPKERIVCLVHAGWRGLKSGVMSHAYDFLRAHWNIDPVNTYVGLGPALCRACSDFTNPETEAPELKKFFRMNNTIDLRDALDDELAGLGVPKKRIERLQDCTRCHPEQYWTYRGGDREAVQRGCTNCLAVTLRS